MRVIQFDKFAGNSALYSGMINKWGYVLLNVNIAHNYLSKFIQGLSILSQQFQGIIVLIEMFP